MAELLLEFYSEEIPSKLQKEAANIIKDFFAKKLTEAEIKFDKISPYYTARRLTLFVEGLSPFGGDKIEEIKGPSIDAPQKAIEGFLKRAQLDFIDQADKTDLGKKGIFYFARKVQKGQATQDVIAESVLALLKNFPWPKSMRWGLNSLEEQPLKWIRPLRNILCIWVEKENGNYGEAKIIPITIGGLESNDQTFGHPFMSDELPIRVKNFQDYQEKLYQNKVILDFYDRLIVILEGLRPIIKKGFWCFESQNRLRDFFTEERKITREDLLNLKVLNWGLLEEVVGLVEWPVVLIGNVNPYFFQNRIPVEIVETTIKKNQKCFVIFEDEEKTKLVDQFVIIANLEAKDGGLQIIKGNEKVIHARLSDALHFWYQDIHVSTSLEQYVPLNSSYFSELQDTAKCWDLKFDRFFDRFALQLMTEEIIFIQGLGKQSDRIKRLWQLSKRIPESWAKGPDSKNSEFLFLKRALVLCKADLVTQMVREFPELQGVVGAAYAQEQGEEEPIINAIKYHYKPEHSFDTMPNGLSAIISVVDRIDTLVGFWLIDKKPKNSKDPYALRRTALGLALILVHYSYISLDNLIKTSIETYQNQGHIKEQIFENTKFIIEDLKRFIMDRFWNFWSKNSKCCLQLENSSADSATICHYTKNLWYGRNQRLELDLLLDIRNLISFLNEDKSKRILEIYRRLENLLLNLSKDSFEFKNLKERKEIDQNLFMTKQEEVLNESLEKFRMEFLPRYNTPCGSAVSSEYYFELMKALDDFLENVFLNVGPEDIRMNRLRLLEQIYYYGVALGLSDKFGR